MKKLARLTGIGYLIIFITGFFANFYVLENLYVASQAEQTATNIITHFSMYVTGCLSFVIMIVADIILAIPLYHLLKQTSKKMAKLSSIFRFTNGLVFFGALQALFLIGYQAYQSPQTVSTEVLSHMETFIFIWNLGLLIFGIHLLLLGILLVKSSSFPSLIGILLVVAGLGYWVDIIAQFFYANYTEYASTFENIVILPAVLGEFSLTLFLLIKGVRLPKNPNKYLAKHIIANK